MSFSSNVASPTVRLRDNHDSGGGPGKALAIGLGVTLAFAVLEVVAGVWSGSLALVSDAGHMLVDSAGLVLALAATLIARRGADLRRTYGYARVEVLVVPLHVLFMVLLAVYIVYEGVGRVGDNPEIAGWPVLAVGAVGLGLNLAVFRLLHGHSHSNLNARSASLEVMADAMGSIGVIISAVLLLVFGWGWADLVISLLIGLLVVPRALMLLRQSVAILLEGTPPGVDVAAIERDAGAVPGVLAIHDLHVWSLAPSFMSLSAHVEVPTMTGCGRVLADLSVLLRDRYGISHVTLQPETHELHTEIDCCLYPDAPQLEGHRHSAHPTATS